MVTNVPTEKDIDNIGVMLVNLQKLTKNTNSLKKPLDTLYFINNRSICKISDRDPNFIEKHVIAQRNMKELPRKFPNRKIFYICDKNIVVNEKEEEDDDLDFFDSDEEEDDDDEFGFCDFNAPQADEKKETFKKIEKITEEKDKIPE